LLSSPNAVITTFFILATSHPRSHSLTAKIRGR
jgi:hypothetical protein